MTGSIHYIVLFFISFFQNQYHLQDSPTDFAQIDTAGWININEASPSIVIDLKYATKDNFVKEQMYNCAECYLRKEVAIAVGKIQADLEKENLGLKVFDCYRPRPVQWALWKKIPNPTYVADPRKGSMHNRGSAVDLTIVNKEKEELDMGTDFDFFGPEAHSTYTGHSATILANRKKLKSIMEKYGFRGIRTEWWHYSYRQKSYPLADWVWECNNEKP